MEGTGRFSPLPMPYLEVYDHEPLGGEPAPLLLKGEAPMPSKDAASRLGAQQAHHSPTPQPQRRLFCSSPRESRSLTDVSRTPRDRARRQLPRSRRPDDDREAAARSLPLGRGGYNLAWQQPPQQQRQPLSGKKDTPAPTPRGDYTTPRGTLNLEREPSGDQWATTVHRGMGHWVPSSTSLDKSALPSKELRVRASSQEPRAEVKSQLAEHGSQYCQTLEATKEPELESFQNLKDAHSESMIPARDKKIVNLMLERLKKARRIQELQHEASEAWEEVKRCDQRFQVMMEKERQLQLSKSKEQWERQKEERRARLSKEQQERLETWEKEMALRESKWKRQVQEQESQRREKLERARVQAEYRKHCQEQMLKEKEVLQKDLREQNIQQLQEKMVQACYKRQLKNSEGRKKLQESNLDSSASHQFRKVLLDSQNKAEEILKRLSLEQRSQRSQEIHQRLIEEKHRELKEKAQKEEEHLLLAKWRAEETDEQKKLHKKMLVELGDLKIQQARDNVHKNIKDKADRIREFNFLREKNHYFLKQKAEEEAKCHVEGIKEAIKRKEQKMNQISRQKDASIEESRKIAQASWQMREKVKALQISFDQMAWEAQFSANLHRGSH
ncbi:coiled-coil domain-containing protein 185-like [Vombatus ursinus]|uniref:coiled-coil domain-containing protein 185-like n=1 Tax=Vombatus ursinus TaxID=29139 RepID=UPI000FFCFAA8|nr:coiled-coil domain-containing protein 185-like [Vombatus ursinus]XP_027726761.1 coiled-coil domain-containing protein 185-like [Vombatus ursinus]